MNTLKTVEELLPVMGPIYSDLSTQVAYKEGYNQAIRENQAIADVLCGLFDGLNGEIFIDREESKQIIRDTLSNKV